jgi:integrase
MYKRGDSWFTDFWCNGERHQKSWGPISKTVAKKKDDKFKTEVREGKHQQKTKRIRFETLAEKYLVYARLNKKPSTARRNEVSINMLMPYFKGKLLGSINSFMLEQYKKARRDQGEKGRAPATINRDIDCIKNMMKKAVEWGYLNRNPLEGVKHLKEDNEKMWVLTPEEEGRLLDECENRIQRKGNKYLKDMAHFALHTGMRQDEIFKLTKPKVKLKLRYIDVTDTKTGEDRRVPINDTAYGILKKRLNETESEYLFQNTKGGKLTVLTNAFWTAVKEAGLIRFEIKKFGKKQIEEKIRFRFHDLRHTFGSRLGMAGTDLKTIMEIMGHKTTKVAMRYQHPAPEHKLNAVKILDQVPSKVPTGKIVPLKLSDKSV